MNELFYHLLKNTLDARFPRSKRHAIMYIIISKMSSSLKERNSIIQYAIRNGFPYTSNLSTDLSNIDIVRKSYNVSLIDTSKNRTTNYIGYAMVTIEDNCIYIAYLWIDKQCKGNGLGTKFVDLILSNNYWKHFQKNYFRVECDNSTIKFWFKMNFNFFPSMKSISHDRFHILYRKI